jgi:Holliday junction resolvase RusA-like endonuclease
MDATPITFSVPGQPVPQPRPRISTRGGFGRAYVEKAHPIHVYRQAVQLAAIAAARDYRHKTTDNHVVLVISAVFARPPSHLAKDGTPRASAPAFPPRVDWDNIGKGVSDAITDSGAIWLDDDQVVDGRVLKRYAYFGEQARTVITITRYDARPDP